MSGTQKVPSAGSIWRPRLRVWAALMVLLGLTLGSAYLPLGAFNSVVNLGIAVLKAILVAVFFMELRAAGQLVRLTALVGLVFILIMFSLTFTDVSWPRF
jgi:cytochrome c oxidase subunit 4